MKARHVLLAMSLTTAAWLAFFGDKTPATGVAEPVSTKPINTAIKSVQSTMPGQAVKQEREPLILTLQARDTLIDIPRSGKESDRLFDNQTWAPPPPPPPKPAPPMPPTAPPLPFKYLGKKIEDNVWEVYLSRGEQTFIAREQTVIDGTYRVDSVKPPVFSLTYLPLNQVQTLAIGAPD